MLHASTSSSHLGSLQELQLQSLLLPADTLAGVFRSVATLVVQRWVKAE